MTGVFYDPATRQLIRVTGVPEREWLLVTHDLNPGPNQCRRILREWLSTEDLFCVDWSGIEGVCIEGIYPERRSA
jgi:hypothetical protein